ncbi:uncharacterized protein CMU_040970 [Cryptosporidium muris RN66]|uniref:Uncharacterized protein n=1 Tax=Cryptosporidium muris (strain RN66) TaxID=441375 RepID=B6A9Y6_CRYMR|nr:uncharacterized protein CMU_040970 [Cryptosporidium muris RN66]EEA05027.1 hypothetical protein CMU_040970 [Cryptosporidium muris RN66]|eukprot:XP_002139376.1 hypothetical protein [Cryptosporidium muris RN66]
MNKISKVATIFLQCLLSVKVTGIADATAFFNALSDYYGRDFSNIHEMIVYCNDKLRPLLLEISYSSSYNHGEFIGIKSNLFGSDIFPSEPNIDKAAFWTLGFKRSKEYNICKATSDGPIPETEVLNLIISNTKYSKQYGMFLNAHFADKFIQFVQF